jgi:hypothetical protein
MKDPAVLFYFQDFLVGTEFMTDEEVGKYKRILCHQADKGALTLSQVKRICSGSVPEAIMEKLLQDDEGKYYQERMRSEREKRICYSESRRKNREAKDNNICETYDKHMENENENINKDVIIVNQLKVQFKIFQQMYPGTKRGSDIEFTNLTKKHKDWANIIPILSDRLTYQRCCRAEKLEAGGFVPEWKNLQTWINQRCWEEEIAINNIKHGIDKKNNGATSEEVLGAVNKYFPIEGYPK